MAFIEGALDRFAINAFACETYHSISAGEREKLLAAMELLPHTSRTITDKAELRRECDRVIAQGYSTDWAEADEGIHCVAAPVFSHHSQLLATLWVSAPSRRLAKESFPNAAKLVMRAADKISRRIQQ